MTRRAMLLDALAATPADVGLLLRRLPAAAAGVRPAADVWSVADVLCHLAVTEGLYRARLQRVVGEERPFLPYIHPDAAGHEAERPLAELIADFAAARAETLVFLRELPPGAWQRRAVHETLGETTFRYLVQGLVDHDTAHLSQLAALLQRRRAAGEGEGG